MCGKDGSSWKEGIKVLSFDNNDNYFTIIQLTIISRTKEGYQKKQETQLIR